MAIMTKHIKTVEPFNPPADDLVPFKSMPSWLDPRPDLKADSQLWHELFTLAEQQYGEKLLQVLNGFRCGGTRIKPGKTTWVLRPDIDSTGRRAWESQEEYDEMKRKYLQRWIDNGVLVYLLQELTKKYPLPK